MERNLDIFLLGGGKPYSWWGSVLGGIEWVEDLMAIHVDHFLLSGTNDFETNFISKLQNKFLIGKENQIIFQYLGSNLVENDSN